MKPKMENNIKSRLYELDSRKLRHVLPDRPGVYLFKDLQGNPIYVGKAKSLKKRVLSYFINRKNGTALPTKTAVMMEKANSVEFIITSTEQEAFLLESNLIKKFIPQYNIILRDDKQYLCLRVGIKEPYPRVSIVRRIKKDGALYFGPFPSANSVRSTYKFIGRVFKLRKCKTVSLPRNKRPCLNFQMDRCFGPCVNSVSETDYMRIVQHVKLFLEGRNRELLDQLRRDMADAAAQLDFEHAANIRNQIRALERTTEHQHMVSPRMEDQDIIGLAKKESICQVVILLVRNGCMVGSRNYTFRRDGFTDSDVIEAVLKQYYPDSGFIPKEILISHRVEGVGSISEWLSGLAGRKVVIHMPIRGEKVKLIKMARTNAENLLMGHMKLQNEDLMDSVKSVLRLRRLPRRIEGVDISNFKGDMAVGAVVAFVDGRPYKQGYRNYRIREIDGIDDYGMMAELIKMRVSKGNPPDLFLVDGGKGHLSAVKRVLDEHPFPEPPEIVSIAKSDARGEERYDKIYMPDRKNPLKLRPGHPVLLFLMKIRDEAHRRAISYHRMLKQKDIRKSRLDLISGIGPKRKRLLLRYFKDIYSISKASTDDLTKVPGISQSLARNIVAFFMRS